MNREMVNMTNEEMFLALMGRMDGVESSLGKLDCKIDGVEERLTGRIDDVETKLSGRIDDVETKLSGRI
ncbi:MAG: hypothetical protein HDR17_14810, partial [Lachnospiraceae bacterium]|nr:hypothetical protein [Lachnospiraceae bacterium]